jgi:NitT/TauT family transport system substrate-binding protein
MAVKTRTLPRRQFINAAAGLALAQTLPGCAWLVEQPVAIAVHVWAGYEPMFLARSEGWLEESKVRLVETASATDSLQALAEGRVAGAALTLDEVFKARENGLPLSVVLIFDISAGADMLVVRPGITRLADLRAQRIGFEQGAVGELMLAEVLRSAGLSKSDVTRVPLTIDRQPEAWQRQQVDALITYEPMASQLLALGALRLFDSRQIPNTIVDVLAIRSDALDAGHASAVRHLLAGHFRALDHLARNPQDAAYRMARHLNLPADQVMRAFKGLVLPDATNNYRLLAGASPALLVSARKLSAIMVNSELLKKDDPLSALIRADFLPADALKY